MTTALCTEGSGPFYFLYSVKNIANNERRCFEMTEIEKIRLSNERKLKGMKWGVRKYQTNDGRLTAEGKTRYLTEEQIFRRGETGKGERNAPGNRRTEGLAMGNHVEERIRGRGLTSP